MPEFDRVLVAVIDEQDASSETIEAGWSGTGGARQRLQCHHNRLYGVNVCFEGQCSAEADAAVCPDDWPVIQFNSTDEVVPSSTVI